MKFQNAWTNLAKENLTLKLVLICTSLVAMGSMAIAAHESMKGAIVIDRGCFTQTAKPGNEERSESEIKSFLKEAVSQRFDTQITPSELFLSQDEIRNKTQEQKELATRSIEQATILRTATIQGETATVQIDRVVGVGEIKSVFNIQGIVTLLTSARSTDNPYGLKAIRFQEVKKEEKK